MYKYFANQLQIWLANGQNCVAFCYAILNKFFRHYYCSTEYLSQTLLWISVTFYLDCNKLETVNVAYCRPTVGYQQTVFSRQNLSSNDVRFWCLKIIMVLDHRYSNEAERAGWDIYDVFELKKPFGFHSLYKTISALWGLIMNVNRCW